MRPFAILADATCDLPKNLQEQYDIHTLPGHVVLPDKREVPGLPQWDFCSREEFYRDLKKNPNGYTTSPANVAEMAAAMEAQLAKGLDVLMMTISSGISGAYNFSLQAKAMMEEKFPDAKIVCVDSLRFGPGFGLMVLHAAQCRTEGKTLEETEAYLLDNRNRFHQSGWHDDLSFVAKKGRITHAKAFFGTLAGIKPLGEADYNGLTTVLAKAKGTKAAYAAMLGYIRETAEDIENQIVIIGHSNRQAHAEQYKEMIENQFHPKAIYICDICACCGVNTGPGVMAAYYVGKPISADLSEEKKILEACLQAGGE